MANKLSVAVVGCGYWGPNLIRNFSENSGARLAWIVDQDPAQRSRFADRYPQARVAGDLTEALADPELSAVAIAVPVRAHFELARRCLEAGKHVLIEKPMVATIEQGEALVALARRRGLTLMVDHTFIYTGAVRKIRDLVNTGELGEVYYFDSVRVNLGLFQRDVNVIWDLAPHDLSIMDFVLAKRPAQVSAHAACHGDCGQLETMAYLTLRFPDRTLAHFHVNWLAPAKIRRIIIGGSKKMLVYDDLSSDEKIRIYDKGVMTKDGPQPDSNKILAGYRFGDLHIPMVDPTEALKRVVQHFLDCIAAAAPPESDGEAGLRVVKILQAAQASLDRQGAFDEI